MTRRRAKVLSPSTDELPPRARFRRALRLCLLSAVAPGSAQLAVGNRWVGRVALGLYALGLVALGWLALSYRDDRAGLIGLVTDPDVLQVFRFGVAAAAVAWTALFVDAWRLARPLQLTRARAAVVIVVNTALVAGVLGVALYASQVSNAGRQAVQEVFTATTTSPPLQGRYNILLIGSDSGKGRTGIRPDSMTVVSIDASTGSTVLVSLPRNLEDVPFREGSPMRELFPYGYNCGSECLLNAVHTEAENRTDLYPGAKDPGLEATIDAVEGVTDLPINYYVMINLRGFSSLVDAVGGVEIDVRTRLAMFGHDDLDQQRYIEPGLQRLDGNEALWYARSRVQSDDFTRMGRQKCLMSAMLDQLSPQKVLLNATDLARSSAQLISTNMPSEELGEFADLALKARSTKIRTVSLVPPLISVVDPDYTQIHRLIKDAIRASERAGGASPSPSSSPSAGASTSTPGASPTTPTPTTPSVPTPSPTATPDESGAQANNVEDLAAAC
ncbi:LCP family protein [Aeromicrobium sp. CnD17-E]|uniref:LCP family protein n=1 Tax=Aeromicrobium sp. CnD17-E TaxID=2954487 RepID=UPI002096950B|nr:LCP family protein [Aeromicrobium sp. CnD17-E]MCO7240959.1 LCP family protein [Aeromicrobium sp. CnD17-E]